MHLRRVMLFVLVIFVLAVPMSLNAGMDCYPGTPIRTPQGHYQCEPFVGGECQYCEVVVQGP